MRIWIPIIFCFSLLACSQSNSSTTPIEKSTLNEVEPNSSAGAADTLYSFKFSKIDLSSLEFTYSHTPSVDHEFLKSALWLNEEELRSQNGYAVYHDTIPGIHFIPIAAIQYGDGIELQARINEGDSLRTFTLASSFGDGMDGWGTATYFLNDSTLIQSEIYESVLYEYQYFTGYENQYVNTKYQYDSLFHLTKLSVDTSYVSWEEVRYNPTNKDKEFLTFSEGFEINNTHCHWKYWVKYLPETNASSDTLWVNLQRQELWTNSGKKLLDLNLQLLLFDYNPINLRELDESPVDGRNLGSTIFYPAPYAVGNEHIDINQDGYSDIQFVTEISAAGANTSVATYLYNPISNTYNYTPVLSGTNMTFDKEKSRVQTFAKMNVNTYLHTFVNLQTESLVEESVEKVLIKGDTLSYFHYIGDSLVDDGVVYPYSGDFSDQLERG